MAGLCGHGAEGVCTTGREGVNADEHHVHQQRPGVAVGQEVQGREENAETPQKVPTKINKLKMYIYKNVTPYRYM